MIYGYARVSSKEQHLDRQIEELKKCTDKIYSDKQSGKDFERKEYQNMIKKLKKGDLVIIKSIDRLGRNYDMIIEEWQRITKKIGADIKVLDMPLLDTTQKHELTGKFISDLVLQILSYVAEVERRNIKQRQAEGIRTAKAKGIKFGRPRLDLDNEIFYKYIRHELKEAECIEILDCSRGTFFRKLKGIRNESRCNI